MLKTVLALLLLASPALGQTGIAAAYAEDVGIGADPAVVFTEQFEESTVGQATAHFSDVQNPGGIFFSSDTVEGGATKSIELRSIGGTNSGAYLFDLLPSAYDKLYVRYYVKYDGSTPYHHSGGAIGGYNPPTSYAQGGAGIAPTGSDRIVVRAEPYDVGGTRLDYYVYWMGMGCTGVNQCFGNSFMWNRNDQIYPSRWICIEMLVQLNSTTSAHDGLLAMWIDGVQVSSLGPGYPTGNWSGDKFTPNSSGPPFAGFQWRNALALQLNWLKIENFTDSAPSGHVGWVRLDHVVVATSYIGPLAVPLPAPVLLTN